ncbi:hypothetical protein LA080_001880 [Diaporthe eres]|nr:hypothetical protein LA080_001880 [Diaporthe eres]
MCDSAKQGNNIIVESSHTWSVETLNCIRSWLDDCTSCYETCLEPKESFGLLPLRLIDVNAANTVQSNLKQTSDLTLEGFDQLRLENSRGVRIVSTNSLSPDTEYLTLSHRWGSPQSIRLCQASSYLLTEDVSPHLLGCEETAVFQHAIHVTRALGFRYIWIDSLCIMQDDESEKTSEIMQMDRIYSNCKLNISAAEADISRGLVFDRNPLSANPCIIEAKVHATQKNVWVRAFHERPFILPGEKPLHKRGWVFQERKLAQRIIHFTKDQVFWECWSLEASETLPRGVPPFRYGNFDKSIGLGSKILHPQRTMSRWYKIVEEYSCTSCTYADDRLLAISALAKRFCSALHADPSDYLAGIWKHDLPLWLCWYQDYEEPLTGKSAPAENEANQEYKYAPSWSWASIMAPVLFPGHYNLTAATTEVVDFEVQRRSPNFFDGTTLCRLRLRGPLCKFRRYLRDGTAWVQIAEDNFIPEVHGIDATRGDCIIILWDRARRPFRKDECFLLHLGVDPSGQNTSEHRGLVLLRAADRGTYSRVAHFCIVLTCDYLDSKVVPVFKGGLNNLSAEDYLEMDSDGQHIFDLI